MEGYHREVTVGSFAVTTSSQSPIAPRSARKPCETPLHGRHGDETRREGGGAQPPHASSSQEHATNGAAG